MTDIAKEIDELRQLDVAALVERYQAVYGKPPRVKHKEWMWKRIAWKIQEQRFGGLSETARNRLEELIAEIKLPVGDQKRTVSGKLKAVGRKGEPSVGAVITRQWHDQEIQVKVVEAGFEWQGVVYRSLSAAAKAVTGVHWNGRLFFGLKGRKQAK